jgi:hypothetical protein
MHAGFLARTTVARETADAGPLGLWISAFESLMTFRSLVKQYLHHPSSLRPGICWRDYILRGCNDLSIEKEIILGSRLCAALFLVRIVGSRCPLAVIAQGYMFQDRRLGNCPAILACKNKKL